MRSNIEDSEIRNSKQKNVRWGSLKFELTGDMLIDPEGPIAYFLDPGGANRQVTLPAFVNGRFYVISNVGSANTIEVLDGNAVSLVTLSVDDTALFISSVSEWVVAVGGSVGPQGAIGPAGTTLRSGSGAPSGGLGIDGEFYIDTTAWDIFGPKAAGVWPAGVSLIGPTGPPGTNGTNGTNGADGAVGPPGPEVVGALKYSEAQSLSAGEKAQVFSNIGATAAGKVMAEAADAAAQTALLSAVVGDSGSGGTKGLVPAPAAGDAAANKFLSSSGAWEVISAELNVANFANIAAALASGGSAQSYVYRLNSGAHSSGKLTWPTINQNALNGMGSAGTIVSFTHADSTQAILINNLAADSYIPRLSGLKLQGAANQGDGLVFDTPTIGPDLRDVWVRDFPGSGFRFDTTYIASAYQLKSFSNATGIEVVNSSGLQFTGGWLSDNTGWQLDVDASSIGNDFNLIEVGNSDASASKGGIRIAGRINRVFVEFYENFTKPRAITLAAGSAGNLVEFAYANPLDIWDDGVLNRYQIVQGAPIENYSASFGFNGDLIGNDHLVNQWPYSTWEQGVGTRTTARGATAPTAAVSTSIGWAGSSSLELDWGTTKESGVNFDPTFSVTAGDMLLVMCKVRADRDFTADERLNLVIRGTADVARETMQMSDLHSGRWLTRAMLYNAVATETISLSMGLTALATHGALKTYLTHMVVAVNPRRFVSLPNYSASTRTVDIDGLYVPSVLIHKGSLDIPRAGLRAPLHGSLSFTGGEVGTDADTAEKTLRSYSVAGYTLNTDGQGVVLRAGGYFGPNANGKRVRAYFGGVGMGDSGVVTDNNTYWHLEMTIRRTAINAAMCTGFVATASVMKPFSAPLSVDLTSALDLKLTGQNSVATANDAVIRFFEVDYKS